MATLPPGPKGEYWGPLNYQSWRADMFGFLTALTHGYGDVVGFDLGHSPCILVNGALQVRELFVEREECLRKPQFVKDSNCGHWGDGLTTLEGSLWRSRRRLLQSSLRVSPSPPVLAVVVQYTKDMLDRWSSDDEVDLIRELRILTARIALRTVLDAELQGYGPSEDRSGAVPFPEAYGEDYLSVPGGDPAAPLIMKRPRAPRRMDATIRIIDERIASGAERGDVLSSLVCARLSDGTPLTRDEILGEVIQMLYAGHLTIPSSLVNFWRDIAAADIAGRLAGEAEFLCQSGMPDLAAITDSYCIAALKESMRLHPPAPILYREVEKAFELDGFDFARDVAVWVSPQLLHNDARYFPEPACFLPERFMKESLTVTTKSPYFPFGAGQRVCIASRLALHQMAIIGLLTARKFELLPTENMAKNFRLRGRNREHC